MVGLREAMQGVKRQRGILTGHHPGLSVTTRQIYEISIPSRRSKPCVEAGLLPTNKILMKRQIVSCDAWKLGTRNELHALVGCRERRTSPAYVVIGPYTHLFSLLTHSHLTWLDAAPPPSLILTYSPTDPPHPKQFLFF